MADALPNGFAGFAPRDVNNAMFDLTLNLPKLSGSTVAIKKGTPLIYDTNSCAGAARQGTNEKVEIDLTNGGSVPTTGSFYLLWTPPNGTQLTIGPIAYNASVSDVQKAWDAAVGPGNTLIANEDSGTGVWPTAAVDYSITFKGKYSARNVGAVTVGTNTMDQTGAPNITVATAGVEGHVTSTTLIGFANDWDAGGSIVNWDALFPKAPNLDDPYGSTKQYLIQRALPGRRFVANYDPLYALAQSVVSTTAVDIGYNLDNDQFFIKPTTTVGLVYVTGLIDPIGKYGGLVEFELKTAAIALV